MMFRRSLKQRRPFQSADSGECWRSSASAAGRLRNSIKMSRPCCLWKPAVKPQPERLLKASQTYLLTSCRVSDFFSSLCFFTIFNTRSNKITENNRDLMSVKPLSCFLRPPAVGLWLWQTRTWTRQAGPNWTESGSSPAWERWYDLCFSKMGQRKHHELKEGKMKQ